MSAPNSPTSEQLQTLTPDLRPSVFARLLRHKAVGGKPFPRSHRPFIHEANPYSSHPADLVRGRAHAPGTDRGDGRGGDWYFCFPSKYQETVAGRRAKRRSRTVGAQDGCWHSESKKKPIQDRAYVTPFSYKMKVLENAKFKHQRTGWCMAEIQLEENVELVLCRVYRSPRPSSAARGERGAPAPPLIDQISPCAGRISPASGGSGAMSELGKGWMIRCQSGAAAAAAAADTVMKFGGSSIPSAEGMKEAASIVLSFPEGTPAPVVVLSAMGKTTTNLLMAADNALRWRTHKTWEIRELDAVQELHLSTVDALGLDRSIISGSLDELKQLLKHVALDHTLTPKTRDIILSHGELMSTTIFSAYLNKLGEGAQQEWERSAISNVGSGGSDLAAISIARELRARKIVVWKDVNGLFTCDPNVFESALPLPYLNFNEATALGFFAAQSMELALEIGIPVIVKSLYNPQAPGTMLTKTREMNESELTRIMLTSNLTMLDIKSTGAVDRSRFVTKAFSIFTKFGISVDHAVISQCEVLIILVPSKLLSHESIQMQKLDVVIEELQQIAAVHALSHRSFISLIGTAEMSTTILEKAFGALTRINVKTQMSSHGSSKVMNIFLVVNDNEATNCVEALHSEFVEKNLSEVHGADSEHNSSLVPVSSSVAASSGDKRKPDDEHRTQCLDTETDDYHMDMRVLSGNFDNTLTFIAEEDFTNDVEAVVVEHWSLFAGEEEGVYVAPHTYQFLEGGNSSLVPVSSSAAASSGDKRKPDDEHGTQCLDTETDDYHMDMRVLSGNFDNTLTFIAEEDFINDVEAVVVEHWSLFAGEEEGVYVAPHTYQFLEGGCTSSSLPSSPLQTTGRIPEGESQVPEHRLDHRSQPSTCSVSARLMFPFME